MEAFIESDVNGDGFVDTVHVEQDAAGGLTATADTNGDGLIDVATYDADADGIAEATAVDVDFDGVADVVTAQQPGFAGA